MVLPNHPFLTLTITTNFRPLRTFEIADTAMS